jgi:hypothetical protein
MKARKAAKAGSEKGDNPVEEGPGVNENAQLQRDEAEPKAREHLKSDNFFSTLCH